MTNESKGLLANFTGDSYWKRIHFIKVSWKMTPNIFISIFYFRYVSHRKTCQTSEKKKNIISIFYILDDDILNYDMLKVRRSL